jgi:hypothetical protein
MVNFVKVASFNSPVEANFVRNILAEEGIESYLENEAAVDMLWVLNNAIGGVKLLVNPSDVERARRVIDRHSPELVSRENEKPRAASGGKCLNCNAKLEPGFEVCWSCGEPIENTIETGERESVTAAASDSENASDASTENQDRKTAETSRLTTIEEADDLAKKAWFASILGFFICMPFLLHLYSLLVVFFLIAHRFPLSRKGSRRLVGAIVVDICGIVYYGWMVMWMSR